MQMRAVPCRQKHKCLLFCCSINLCAGAWWDVPDLCCLRSRGTPALVPLPPSTTFSIDPLYPIPCLAPAAQLLYPVGLVDFRAPKCGDFCSCSPAASWKMVPGYKHPAREQQLLQGGCSLLAELPK